MDTCSKHHHSEYDWSPDVSDNSCSNCRKQSNHCGKHFEHCVEDVLAAILEAQRRANEENHCDTSCRQSIDELLGKHRRRVKNTIPFILYCGCKPFKGTGVIAYSSKTGKRFKCINTFIFKIKDLKKGCAVLELLAFKSDLTHRPDGHKKCGGNEACSPCCQINNKCVADLIKTGICINVDLSMLTAITCLPAVSLK